MGNLNDTYETRKRYDEQVAKIAREIKSLGAEYGYNPHIVAGHVKLEITLAKQPQHHGHRPERRVTNSPHYSSTCQCRNCRVVRADEARAKGVS